MITKRRAKWLHDAYVHLPVEFDMKPDGHRPVSEIRRCPTICSSKPWRTWESRVTRRLERIVDIFGFPLVVPSDEATEQAETKVAKDIAVPEDDARFHEAQRRPVQLRLMACRVP